MHDVVIVGASVAGASLATHLARRGFSVLLIERASFPRRKACGEGLFPGGVAELDRLGVLSGLVERGRTLESLRLKIGGITADAALAAPGKFAFGIERGVLDEALLRLAERSGVEVRLGLRATGLGELPSGRYDAVETDAGRFRGRAIVAADGLGSRLRRTAGLDRGANGKRFGVSAHYLLPETAPPRVEVHFREGHEVYLTPVGERKVNVALLLDRGIARSLAGALGATFDGLVRRSGALPPAAELLDEPLAAGPFPAASRRAWRANLLLVGDAAGFFDGISGEGMSLALISARLAAVALGAYLETGDTSAFKHYDRQRRLLERNSTLVARLMLALAARPRLGRLALRNLSRRPETFARLVAVSQSEVALSALRPRDVLSLVVGI